MLLNILINTLGTPKNYSISNSKRTKFEFNCPNCTEENMGIPDNKYNLGVLITTKEKKFNCWKCGYKGSDIKYLLKKYANEIDYNTYIEFDLGYSTIGEEKKKFYYINLPKEFIGFQDFDLENEEHKKAYDYLINERKLDINLIIKRKIGACFEGYYGGRIIIPSFDTNGELNYFIGRHFLGGSPTYLAPDKEKDTFIFNENLINWNHPIFLVEGCFDELSLPINTIPLIGKRILENLVQKLLIANIPVFIVLDEGERESKEANDIKQYLLLRGIKIVNIIKVNHKDLNKILTDFGKKMIIDDILLQPHI